jgi:hypothetical protein
MSLSGRGYKRNGLQKADLSWTGPSGTSFDLYRSGLKIATGPDHRPHRQHQHEELGELHIQGLRGRDRSLFERSDGDLLMRA